MGFFAQRCPNCGRSVAKAATYCSGCGCLASEAWSTCGSCGASVGAESKHCWKCGAEQDVEGRRRFYGDRWHRSGSDFAVRVDLAVPEKTLHHGIQVDEGTLALLFQNGRYVGTLDPGYHTIDNFFQRLVGLDKGREAHAVLIDTQAAEVDFLVNDVRVENHIPIDVRCRLLFQVADPKMFTDAFLVSASSFTTEDLANHFHAHVREALQVMLARRKVDELLTEVRTRELIEGELLGHLGPKLAPCGLRATGVRLADFGGESIEGFRQKLGDLHRMVREQELQRRLGEALREDKVSAFRDEEQLKDYYEKITHELGFKSAEREEERRKFMQASEHRVQVEGLRQDYERRRAEIVNRLDEQKLRYQSEIADVVHDIERRKLVFGEDLRQQEERGKQGIRRQEDQLAMDMKAAEQALGLASKANVVKGQKDRQDVELRLFEEKQKLEMRGAASLQTLLATLPKEQGELLLKQYELQTRAGLPPEQALAMIAERSPEIAPAIAEILRAKNPPGK